MRTKLLLFLLICLLIPTTASAHAGRTDSNGGHTNHATGEYHYHHGYSAHQHPDGVCPYDFDDQTGQSSGTSSGSSSSSIGSSSFDWVIIEDGMFCDFMYNESTDEWMSDNGEYYESSGDLFDCYGFTYDSGCDVWFNEDGFLDDDLCLQDFPDGDLFLCPECGNLMDIYDEDGHDDWCEYLDDEEEEDYDDEYNPSYSSKKGPLATILDIIFVPFELLFSLLELGSFLGGVCILLSIILLFLKGPYYIIKALIDKIRNHKRK